MSASARDLGFPHLPLPSQVLDWRALNELADARRDEYRAARPFPHIALDDLFAPALLDQAIAELPGATANWTTYDNKNEAKQVCSDATVFGPAAEIITHALNSAPFLDFLERLTGIPALIPDPHLRAAGYMKVRPGGFLGLHYDFATQKELKLDRRINALLYLNRDWRSEWGGQLELHSNDPLEAPAHEEKLIEPIFNRLVIFNTPNALHGHRRPIQCPPGRARLCLSWFYYTAPPVPGWAARARPVVFPGLGQFNWARSATLWANRLVPPILFDAVRALRGKQ
ncbi:MAG TPA: 2OG-Fe(II) oxygenase [Steroidobacteraceae bacterium]|nr:2OG-Fe(II) oxygenase [Steroidobacteraceae bacterium]